MGILKTATDGTYNYHAVSASDNPRIISGEQAHGGVALLWKYSINDFVTPIKSIQSDRIVGIKCEFSGCRPLFILGVYLPSSNHTLDEFQECLDLLWAFYESLSADSFVIVLGDVNGDFGNCLGVRGKKEPNVRGKLLIDFANFFNVCPVNLLSSCSGPTYDNGFAAQVSAHVKESFEACLDDPGGILNEPLTYDEIANVCSKLKPGVCGVLLDYEHIRYAGPPLWNLLFILYPECFCQFSVPKNIKKGIILPLFKDKGAKANNKDSYRGITLCPTLCKIYEMVLLVKHNVIYLVPGLVGALYYHQ